MEKGRGGEGRGEMRRGEERGALCDTLDNQIRNMLKSENLVSIIFSIRKFKRTAPVPQPNNTDFYESKS